MRVSRLFGTTLREAPSDVDIVSHQLLLRAGYVRQLAAGIFSYLPLAQRSLTKIEQILRQEMDAIGGQEINMPVVHPAELWQQSGRWSEIDETMARFVDRKGRDMLLAMTHEEVVASLAASDIYSYRQLPLLVYQIQTKFRDELRARGGLIRVREFVMKDSYSLDVDDEGLRQQYIAHYNAYLRIGARAGLRLTAVESDVGMMGGKVAHEFMYITPIGEDSLVLCSKCDYAANREVADFVRQPEDGGPAKPSEKVHTPGTKTIEELAAYLDLPASRTGKVVFLVGTFGAEQPSKVIVAVVRGDMEANPVRIANLTGALGLRPAHEEEIAEIGAVAGFASPIGIDRAKAVVIVDELVTQSVNLVLGANEPDHHLLNTNCGRDYEPDLVGTIAAAFEGARCVQCGAALELARGVEVGNIFQLGTRYSEPMGATYTDEEGAEHPIVLGSYGIGVGRLLACVAEEYRDERGLALPITVAPYDVNLVSLARQEATSQAAEELYQGLRQAGVEVLFDDREASAGVKLADADLRGVPIRMLVSERSLKEDRVELKRRTEKEARLVARQEAVAAARQEIGQLEAEAKALVEQVPVWGGD